MRNYFFGTALGLLVAGSLSVAQPAGATMWRNYASKFVLDGPYYLETTASNKGAPLVIFNIFPSYDQIFREFWLRPDGTGSGYVWLVPREQPLTGNQVVGVAGGNMSNGTALISWPRNGSLDQFWYPAYWFNDDNGAFCYAFFDRQNMSKVMGVKGGLLHFYGGQAVIIWDFYNDATNHPDQAWCAYALDDKGKEVPQFPPPF